MNWEQTDQDAAATPGAVRPYFSGSSVLSTTSRRATLTYRAARLSNSAVHGGWASRGFAVEATAGAPCERSGLPSTRRASEWSTCAKFKTLEEGHDLLL